MLILYPSETRQPSVEYAVSRLQKEGLLDSSKVTVMCYENLTKDDPDFAKALADAGKVIVLSQAVSRNEVIAGAMDQVHKAGGQVVLLSLNLPYDAACYEEADAVLCAYMYRRSAEREKISPLKTSFCTSAGSGWKSGETKESNCGTYFTRKQNTKHSENSGINKKWGCRTNV